MAQLVLQLLVGGIVRRQVAVAAEDLIETTLCLDPGALQLPTLISVVRILGAVTGAGFEPVDDAAHGEVAEVVNMKYLNHSPDTWTDQTVQLRVVPIRLDEIDLYAEISSVRDTLVEASEDFLISQSYGDDSACRQAQDRMVERVTVSVREHRDWWDRLPGFLLRTGISILLEAILPVPLKLVISGAVRAFD